MYKAVSSVSLLGFGYVLCLLALPRCLAVLPPCWLSGLAARSCLAHERPCLASFGAPHLAPPAPCSRATAPPLVALARACTPPRGALQAGTRGAVLAPHPPRCALALLVGTRTLSVLLARRRCRLPAWSPCQTPGPSPRQRPPPARVAGCSPPGTAAALSLPPRCLRALELRPRGGSLPVPVTTVRLGALGPTGSPSRAAPPSARGSGMGASRIHSWRCRPAPCWLPALARGARRPPHPPRPLRRLPERPCHRLPASRG